MIIGLAGRIGTGKDVVAEEIVAQDMRFRRMSFATMLKHIAGELVGVTGDIFNNREFKNMPLGSRWSEKTGRQILIDIGVSLREHVHPDVWVNALESEWFIKYPNNHIVISDVRFKNEALWIKKHGGIVVRVDRLAPPQEWHHIYSLEHEHDFDEPLMTSEDFCSRVKRFDNEWAAMAIIASTTETNMDGWRYDHKVVMGHGASYPQIAAHDILEFFDAK